MGALSEYGAEIGMRVTCQRCGKQIFLKQTGYSSADAAMRNRHSFYDQFEPMPAGWKVKHDANGWLCPVCVKLFDRAIKEFMGKGDA